MQVGLAGAVVAVVTVGISVSADDVIPDGVKIKVEEAAAVVDVGTAVSEVPVSKMAVTKVVGIKEVGENTLVAGPSVTGVDTLTGVTVGDVGAYVEEDVAESIGNIVDDWVGELVEAELVEVELMEAELVEVGFVELEEDVGVLEEDLIELDMDDFVVDDKPLVELTDRRAEDVVGFVAEVIAGEALVEVEDHEGLEEVFVRVGKDD